MANLQYIGARYVPKFFLNPDDQSNDWKSGVLYEALTIVTYNNDSYTSKVTVPDTVGDPASNPEYWACTTKYTAALIALQNTVAQKVDKMNATVDSEVGDILFKAVNALENTIFEMRSLDVNGQGGLSVGKYAGSVNEGEANTFIGDYAGQDNTTGRRNTAVGTYAQFRKTTGKYNTAIGYVAESKNVNGNYNTTVGYGAFENNTSGSNNTSIGAHSNLFNETGAANTAVGYFANYNGTGSNNTAVGTNAGRNATTGNNNTYIGYGSDADSNDLDCSNSIAIGSGTKVGGDNSIAIGNTANTKENNSIAIGNGATVSNESGISIGSLTAGQRESIIGHYLTQKTKIRGSLGIPVHLFDDNFIPSDSDYAQIFISKTTGDLKVKFSDGTIKTIATLS